MKDVPELCEMKTGEPEANAYQTHQMISFELLLEFFLKLLDTTNE